MKPELIPCESSYLTITGDIVHCKNLGRHAVHQGLHGADDFTWRNEHAYKEDIPKQQAASDKQVGGTHYKNKGNLQPIDVIDAWELDFYEGSALKYIARHRQKNGAEDIKKAIHYLQLLLERQYP